MFKKLMDIFLTKTEVGEIDLEQQRERILHDDFDKELMTKLFDGQNKTLLDEFFVKSAIAHNVEAMDFFKNLGADINFVYNGNSALTACSRITSHGDGEYRYVPVAKYLLEQEGLNIEAKSDDGLTAEEHSIKRGNNKIALLINPEISRDKLTQKPSDIGFPGDCIM